MEENKAKFLKILFNKGETVCVSDCKGGYHSVSQSFDNIVLISPKEEKEPRAIQEEDINLIAINPISGYRRDENVTSYRSFLIEIDDGELQEQLSYVKQMGMPYSACVFSGNKSLHFLITLDEDLPTYELYYDIAEWILAIMEKADSVTKNPSRSIRYPNNIRKDGKKLKQSLVEINDRIPMYELAKWLRQWEHLNPAEIRKRKKSKTTRKVNGIPRWILDKIVNGIDESRGRNNEWFFIAMELAKAGYTDEQMIELAEQYFTPERDFTQREWETIMKSAYKRHLRQV